MLGQREVARRSQAAGPARPVFALDDDWKLTYANPGAKSILETSREDVEGYEIWPLVPDGVRSSYRSILEEARERGEAVEDEVGCTRGRGAFRVEAFPVGDGLAVHLEDLGGRIGQQREFDARERSLWRAFTIIADAEASLPAQVGALLGLVRRIFGTEVAALARVEEGRGVRRVLAADTKAGIGDRWMPTVGEDEALSGHPLCEDVIRIGRTFSSADLRHHAPELAAREDVEAYVGTPVRVDGRGYGTLAAYTIEPRQDAFQDWQVAYVDLFADWIGMQIAREGGWPKP